MKQFIGILFSFFAISSFFSQMNDCSDPVVNGCSSSDFVFSSVGDDVEDFPTGSTASGCLNSGDNQLIYLVLTANSSGLLEWSVQGDANTGFLDWAIWPYDPNSTCSELAAGTLAPLACCWNMSGVGFAGMSSAANMPPGAPAGNFQPPITLTPGQTVLLGISNFSGGLDGQNITLTFFDENLISCVPQTPDQTICLGDTATVNIITPGLDSPTFNWLVTTAVSNVTSGVNVLVNPLVTTNYQVAIHQAGTGSQVDFDTIVDFTITVVNPLTPNAGLDQVLCIGNPINLVGTSTYPTDVMLWTNSFVGTTPVPTVSYAPNSASLTPIVTVNQPGLYTFVLHETNPTCPAVTDTCNIVIIEVDQIVSQVSPSCFGALDGEIHITSVLGIEFSFDNGVSWQVSPDGIGFGAGIYTVCSRNAIGCQKCNSVTVVDPPQVVLTVSNDTLICQNGSANLVGTAIGGTSFIYHWGMTTSTSSNQTISPLTDAYYTVMAENQNGCLSAQDSIHVTLRLPLTGNITPNDTICPGFSSLISSSCAGGDNGPYNFNWSTLDVGVGLTDDITDSPASDRLYSVTINDGCETTPIVLNTNVIVSPIAVPLFTVVDDEICESAVFVLNNTTDPTLVGSVVWNISNGDTYSDLVTVNTNPMIAGVYNVEMIVTTPAGCVSSLTLNDFLTSHPKPKALYQYLPNPVRMFNTNVSFINTSENAYTYHWEFEDGVPSSSNELSPKIKFPDGVVDNYDTRLIATSPYGCIDTADLTVYVFEEVLLYAPNTFTPDGDEHNPTWKVIAEGIDLNDFELLIYNRWGEIVWVTHDIHSAWDGRYNSEAAKEGIYTWTLTTKDLTNDAKYYFNGHINLLK